MKTLVGLCLIFLSLAAIAYSFGIRTKQSAGATGYLTCNGRPLPNVLVKLYDKDRFTSMDDKMASTKTDSQGFFQLSGSAREMSKIDPKLYVYHDCEDGWTPCQRRVSVMIPDKYVSNGEMPRQLYNLGTMELAGKFSGETRDCIH